MIYRIIALLVMACGCLAQACTNTTLTIELVEGSESEELARSQLRRLVDQFDIDRWLFTNEVRIDDSQRIPHSHPVLTLNSRYLDDDLGQLATFLHEQFHWYAAERQGQVNSAIAEFRELFPDVPSGRAGARDEYSTYLHLIICDLELAAMQQLSGDSEARRTLSRWQHYTWIYEQVLNNPAVRAVNEKNGLMPP